MPPDAERDLAARPARLVCPCRRTTSPITIALAAAWSGLRIAFAPTLSGAQQRGCRQCGGWRRDLRRSRAKVEDVGVVLEDSLKVFQDHWFPSAANALRAFSAEQWRQIDRALPISPSRAPRCR